MKQTKKKEIWYIIGILITVAAGTILFFFPELIENRYPYSYQNVQEKDSQVQSLNSELLTNESNILAEVNRLKDLEEEKKLVERDAMEVRSGINEDDFVLDIPSILIDLEQNAVLNNVVLEIGYNSITHIKGDEGQSAEDDKYVEPDSESGEIQGEDDIESNAPEEGSSDETSDSEDDKESEDKKEDSANSVEVTKTEDEDEGNTVSEEFIRDNAASIEGIDTTVIPIFIKGSYKNIRNYIKYLDKVGMIEPSSVNLSSSGNEIEGSILLNVFHGEVGL